MIRKGVLHRVCNRCDKTFKPLGKSSRVCEKCYRRKKSNWLEKIYEMQNKKPS